MVRDNWLSSGCVTNPPSEPLLGHQALGYKGSGTKG